MTLGAIAFGLETKNAARVALRSKAGEVRRCCDDVADGGNFKKPPEYWDPETRRKSLQLDERRLYNLAGQMIAACQRWRGAFERGQS